MRRHQLIHKFFILLLLISLTACSSSGGDDDNESDDPNDTPQTGMSFKVLDDNGTPMPGVYLSIYQSDNKTIQETKLTDSNGVANFGSTGRVTVTAAYEGTANEDAEIQTVFGLPEGTYTLFMRDVGCQKVATVSVMATGIGANATSSMLQPAFAGGLVAGGTSTLSNVDICQEHVQTDGQVSLLVMALSGTNLESYGFAIDQAVSDGASYSIVTDQTPATLNWSAADPSRLPEFVAYGAVRKGVSYVASSTSSSVAAASVASSGTLRVADQFPADAFSVQAARNIVSNTCSVYEKHVSFQSNVNINFSDFDISTFTYTAGSELFSWQILGNSDKDQLTVSTFFSATGRDVEWNLSIEPGVESLGLPDLPSEVQSWFERNQLIANRTSLVVSDIAEVNGFDAFQQVLGSGSTRTILDYDVVNICEAGLTSNDPNDP
ncbi:MAG TPA: hypothetical protein DCZ12_07105, partial [Gammaproteobacteria bacterium]|nr:hypothetical protein [Gammaproteobacteria bacterium]